jgi:predicted Zn-dependent protease
MGIPLLLAAILATAPPAPAREKLSAPDESELRATATEAVLEAIKSGDLEEAGKNVQQLIKDTPDDPLALNLLGSVQTKRKEYAAARASFEKALAADPAFFPAQFNLGEILFLEKNYPAAREHFQAMRRADPSNELLQFKVVLCDIQAGDDESARRVMRAMRYPGDSPAWYYAEAAWEIKQGNPKKARRLLATAREIFGEKTELFDESFETIGLKP